MSIIKKTALHFARKKICREAVEQRADLSALAEIPSKSVMAGIIMIAFSYVIGLPAVIGLSILAVWLKEPLIGIVGGPLIYTISTIIFIIGIKMAGKTYFLVFLKWMIRVTLEKILGDDLHLISGAGAGGTCSKEP